MEDPSSIHLVGAMSAGIGEPGCAETGLTETLLTGPADPVAVSASYILHPGDRLKRGPPFLVARLLHVCVGFRIRRPSIRRRCRQQAERWVRALPGLDSSQPVH